MEVLVENTLLGQLVVHIMLRGQLEGRSLRFDLVVGVLVIGVAGWGTKGTHRFLGERDASSLLVLSLQQNRDC